MSAHIQLEEADLLKNCSSIQNTVGHANLHTKKLFEKRRGKDTLPAFEYSGTQII